MRQNQCCESDEKKICDTGNKVGPKARKELKFTAQVQMN